MPAERRNYDENYGLTQARDAKFLSLGIVLLVFSRIEKVEPSGALMKHERAIVATHRRMRKSAPDHRPVCMSRDVLAHRDSVDDLDAADDAE